MEQCLLEKLTGQLVQKSPRILRNSKVHYFVQYSLPQVPKLSRKIPVYTLSFYFFNIHFDITLPFTPVFQVVSFKPRTSRHFFSSHSCNKSQSSHWTWYNHMNNIWWGLQIIKFLIMHFLQPSITSSLWCPNIYFHALNLNTFSRVHPLMWQAQFHAQVKMETKYNKHLCQLLKPEHFKANFKKYNQRHKLLYFIDLQIIKLHDFRNLQV